MVSECLFFHGVKEPPKTAQPRRKPCPAHVEPTSESVDAFFHELFKSIGLSVEAYRSRALNRRIPACLRFLRVKDLDAARLKLKARPELATATASVVLLGVTEFCRDRAVFDQVEQFVIPLLAQRSHRPRVWSAACSDGRELCSAAILLHRAKILEGAELLGTDCRKDAILQAQKALFPAESIDKLPPEWREYFFRDRQGVRVAERLQDHLQWKQANLLKQTEPGPWDLIFWRNMAIYLETKTAERVWRTLIDELAPGGFLISGKADHPPRHTSLFKVAPCIFRKNP